MRDTEVSYLGKKPKLSKKFRSITSSLLPPGAVVGTLEYRLNNFISLNSGPVPQGLLIDDEFYVTEFLFWSPDHGPDGKITRGGGSRTHHRDKDPVIPDNA